MKPKIEPSKMPEGFWSPRKDHENLSLLQKFFEKEYLEVGEIFLNESILLFKNDEISKKLFIETAQFTVESLIRYIKIYTNNDNHNLIFNKIPLN